MKDFKIISANSLDELEVKLLKYIGASDEDWSFMGARDATVVRTDANPKTGVTHNTIEYSQAIYR